MPTCKRCKTEKRYISARGLCKRCSTEAMRHAAYQMRTKRGVIYEKWKLKLRESIEKAERETEI